MKKPLLLIALILTGCRNDAAPDPPPASHPAEAIPVGVSATARASLAETVSGPGRTAALAQEKVRAPFAGTLIELAVGDGDRVRRGDLLATIVSRDSEAALSGARQMEREAKTESEKQDAARALVLAERGLVRAPITAPSDGTVLGHAAARGDRVAEEQEILTIADASSIAFLVDVTQSDLGRIRPGQPVHIEVPGQRARFDGTVHDVLPGANTADFTASVRVDLRGLSGIPPLGLFGTARITVAERPAALVVPDAALVRDDISGTSRIVLRRERPGALDRRDDGASRTGRHGDHGSRALAGAAGRRRRPGRAARGRRGQHAPVSLLHWAHDRALALLLVVGLLATAGVIVVTGMPLAIFPSVTFPVIKVIADAGHEPAARMIPGVTRPLEEALLPLPGMRLVRSTTSRGSAELSANFAWGTDMQVALQRVQDALARIAPDLPPDTHLEVAPMNTALFPILGYALTSDTRSQADLWDLAEYTLKPELVRIPGVSQAQVQGGRRREFQVHLDLEALAARRLAVTDVLTAIKKNNQVLSAGLTEANHELYLSLVDGVVADTEALSRIAVSVPGGGVPALLGDLGTVGVAEAVSYIRTTADGRPAVLINLTRQPAASTVAIAAGVRRLFAQRPDLLPPDVRWTTFYDQAEFVSHSVNGVRDAILIGVGLAALVLLVFLRSFRLALVAVATIPVTIAVVLLALAVAGQTINLMTLGGIAAAIGLIADDAIVVAESIQRHREEGSSAPALTGLSAILRPLIGSSLSTIVIFLPFALLTGVVGAFFQPLALTMAIALSVSFFVSALGVPVVLRATGGARPAASRRAPSPARGLRAASAWAAGLVCVALLGAALLLYRRLGSDFLPAMDEGSIILDYWTPPGTSLTDTDAILNAFERVLLTVPDVRDYSRRTGTQLGFFITEPNRGDYVIRLKPRKDRRDVEAVIADIRARAAAIAPALHTDFGQLLEDNIGDLTGGVPQPIDIRIFGDNQALLQERARAAAAILRGVKGVEDVFDGIVIAGPALTIRVPAADPRWPAQGPRAAARFGLTTEDVQAAIEPAVAGTLAGNIRLGEKLYDLRLFGRDPRGLEALRLRTPTGALVSLGNVASISTGAPEAEIDRENLKTYLGVTARLEGRDLGGAIAEIRGKLERGLRLPPGNHVFFGGLYEQQQDSFRELFFVLLGGMLLVAIVLLFQFGDWRAPLVTAVISVAVLAGVFGALLATGMTLNISSFVGGIMMVGIVGENAVFVIHEAREALRHGAAVPVAWALAARRRRRPVAMTILASAFALAPLALALGEGSQLQQPLAIAVIGGFVLSGFLVLWILPALYCLSDPRGQLACKSIEHGG